MKTYIQNKIERIVKENTGTHFLDSGFKNGRHWQKNKGKKLNFKDDLLIDEYNVTIPIHIFMNTFFETDNITKVLNTLLKKEKKYNWVGESVEILENSIYYNVGSLEIDEKNTSNTYNYENDLSQDFQYNVFRFDNEEYILFQLHNGADIRGGYTNTQVFKITDIDYFYLGQRCDFYDDSNDQQFESFYEIEESEEYILDLKKQCFINKETKNEVYPYCAAIGY